MRWLAKLGEGGVVVESCRWCPFIGRRRREADGGRWHRRRWSNGGLEVCRRRLADGGSRRGRIGRGSGRRPARLWQQWCAAVESDDGAGVVGRWHAAARQRKENREEEEEREEEKERKREGKREERGKRRKR